jgi:hypothetical protein
MDIVRQQFAEFVDPDRLVKWYVAINDTNRLKGRLLFWQEELWADFVAAHEEYKSADFGTICNWFQYCHVHDERLTPKSVRINYGTFHFSKWYLRQRDTHFPSAAVTYGPCWQCSETHRDMFVCSQCDKEFNHFNKRSKAEPRHVQDETFPPNRQPPPRR